MRRTAIGDFPLRLNFKDIYTDHLVFIENKDGSISLFDTTRPNYRETHANMRCYMNYHDIVCEDSPYHFLNFEDISETKIGQQFLEKRPTVRAIHVKSQKVQKIGMIPCDHVSKRHIHRSTA